MGLLNLLFGNAKKARKVVVEKARNEVVYTHAEGVGVFKDHGDMEKQLLGISHRHSLPLPFPLPPLHAEPWHVIRSKKKVLAKLSLEKEEDGSESLRVDYAAGEVGASSGWGFHATPKHAFPGVSSVLCYRVYFPEDFDWKRGGKLPGLFIGHPGATGGNWEYKAGSARVVWQRDGVAAVYLYLPLQVAFDGSKQMAVDTQSDEFKRCCHLTKKGCHLWNSGPNVLRFKKGQWNDVQLVVRLNTIGKQDGYLELTVNGEKKSCHGMAWRTRAHLAVGGVVWQTFYGGSTPEAASPEGAWVKLQGFAV